MIVKHNGKKVLEAYGNVTQVLNTLLQERDEQGNPRYKREELSIEFTPGEKKTLCSSHIYANYPQTKQNSDLADKLYYENLLKAAGVQDLEADIVQRVQSFYDGKSLDEVLADVSAEHKEAYEQLVKVGIRVAWVQQCKAELKAAIAEEREPSFSNYPL